MNRNELEAIADQIENVLAAHRAPSKVTGGHITPRFVQFLVTTDPGTKPSRVESLSREIAIALGVPNARVTTTQGNTVRIEIPRRDPQPLKLLALMARIQTSRIPFATAVLGLADDGAPLLIRLPSPEVGHVLIAGTTGAGKTSLLHTVITSLALTTPRRQLQIVLLGARLNPLAGLPHLLMPIITEDAPAATALRDADRLMEQRAQTRVTDPRVIVVIDELADLDQSVHDPLLRLLQRGRETGLHVVAATKRPASAIVASLVSSFPVRLVGRVISADEARAATGAGGTCAEMLSGTGDFVAVYGQGLIRFQSAYADPREIETIAHQLQQGIRGDDIIQAGRTTGTAPAQPSNTLSGNAVFATFC